MNEEKDTIIMGDLNGHISGLGNQMTNSNGRTILELAERCNLTILNLDDTKTDGLITWESRGQASVIDYALCNQSMYNKIK